MKRAATTAPPDQPVRPARPVRAAVGLIVVAASLPLLAVAVLVWARGWSVHPVGSDSMAPRFRTGSAVVVEPVDPADVRVGSVAVFGDPRQPNRLVTHRVVEAVDRDGVRYLRTRGDANSSNDPHLVPPRLVQGTVQWSVPGLGTLIETLGRPVVARTLVVGPLVVLVALSLGDVVNRRRSARRRLARETLTVENAELRRRLADLEARLPSVRTSDTGTPDGGWVVRSRRRDRDEVYSGVT